MSKSYDVKVLSGIVIAGEVKAPGTTVRNVPDKLAREWLARGKVAVIGDDADDGDEGDETQTAPAQNGKGGGKPAKAPEPDKA